MKEIEQPSSIYEKLTTLLKKKLDLWKEYRTLNYFTFLRFIKLIENSTSKQTPFMKGIENSTSEQTRLIGDNRELYWLAY